MSGKTGEHVGTVYYFEVMYDGDTSDHDFTVLLANIEKSDRRIKQRSERTWSTSDYDDAEQIKQSLTQDMNEPLKVLISQVQKASISFEGHVKDPGQS